MNKIAIPYSLHRVMLVSASPAVAAEDTPVKPTIEEILNDYHQKAFEARSAEDAGETTTYSNRSSSKTLEQETVDTLNAAGYEAYNVTASNYDVLEAELNTDFASIGLSPNSSYVIVISGEDTNNAKNARKPGDNLITPTPDPLQGSDTLFMHTYEGETYTMRYLTITANDTTATSAYTASGISSLINNNTLPYQSIILDCAIVVYSIFDVDVSFVSTVSNWLDELHHGPEIYSTGLQNSYLCGEIAWVRTFTQVYDYYEEEWVSAYSVEYANITSSLVTNIYNPDTNFFEPHETQYKYSTKHSPEYNNTTLRKDQAAYCYEHYLLEYDTTGSIVFGLEFDEIGVEIFRIDTPVF